MNESSRPVRPAFVICLTVAIVASLCGCGKSQIQSLPNDRAVLNISLQEKVRLLAKLGLTNVLFHGNVERDSKGTRLFITVETGTNLNSVQQLRSQQLIVVTAKGVHIKPWHFPANERITDDEEVAVWEHPAPDFTWQVRNGELLPKVSHVEDVSGDWIAVKSEGRAPWIAKLDKPNAVRAELPASTGLISIFAQDEIVHVFARRGWRNAEGPMKYLVCDFSRSNSKPISETTLPWARIAIDMDPSTGFAIINDNNRFLGRTWLLDTKTKKRKSISTSDWTLIVQKEVAMKWIELTRP